MIELSKEAVKILNKLPRDLRERILKTLGTFDDTRYGDVKKLMGYKGLYRLRVGNYRVIFSIEGTIITGVTIKPRGGAYR